MRRRRFRIWAKWGFTIAAAVMVGVAVASGFAGCSRTGVSDDRSLVWAIGVAGGMVEFDYIEDAPHVLPRGAKPGWWIERDRWDWDYLRLGRHSSWHLGILWQRNATGFDAGVHILYPVLLTTIPAVFLWNKDRRRFGPHQCKKCGYDRGGLDPNAKCPECGTTPAGG
jgi:hypothetical protein